MAIILFYDGLVSTKNDGAYFVYVDKKTCGLQFLFSLWCSLTRIEPQRSRVPKVFYVTTQSSTTTLTTNTICYVTLSAISKVCGRKKRFINFDPIDSDKDISVSRTPKLAEDETPVDDLVDENIDLDGSIDRAKVTREGKFLVYWMTTTSISTITSFSSTYSLASIICTPSNYAVSECG